MNKHLKAPTRWVLLFLTDNVKAETLLLISLILVCCVVTPSVADETTVRFTDQTQQAGIHFKHTNGASEEKYLPETMGSGGLFFDYNNDGHLDIYLVNSGTLGPLPNPVDILIT